LPWLVQHDFLTMLARETQALLTDLQRKLESTGGAGGVRRPGGTTTREAETVLRVISARDMHRKERMTYEQ